VHVNLDEEPDSRIKIFSKSAKDSTHDRRKLHDTLRKCLRIEEPNCAFKKRCIIIGEMVVFSNKEQQILEFHHIRKHVSRSGVFLGTDVDSQIREGEHLMIVFFDLLLVDDDLTLRRPYLERRERLSTLITKRKGYAITAERIIIDFSKQNHAQDLLCHQFAAALAHRTEGLVLKPLDMPYFSLGSDENSGLRDYIIKLKKDYLQELGGERDVADFAVIGASFDPKLVHKSNAGNIPFTTFHLGCLVNKEEALRFGYRPLFEVVGMIDLDQCIPSSELKTLNDHGRFCSKPFVRVGQRLKIAAEIGFDVILDQNLSSKMDVVWSDPCVVEVLGSAFEKPANKSYFMLRHPRILKVHLDRTWKEATCMEELKNLADESRLEPECGASQEMSQLVRTLLGKFSRKQKRERLRAVSQSQSEPTTSQATTTRTTPSSAKSSPSLRRERVSPNSKNTSPILVRVDTIDLRPGEPQLADATKCSPDLASKAATDSLPTPKGSALECGPSTIHARGQRNPRKRPSDESLPFPPRKRVARDQNRQPRSERTLADISNNKAPQQSTTKFIRTSKSAKPMDRNIVLHSTSVGCHWLNCPFSNAVVYLSPCISNQKWVSDNLLRSHGTERTSDLQHWQRDNIEVSRRGPIVAESSAWPSMQKIVLVEKKRQESTWALVERIRELGVRDEILFFDWRLLEDMEDWKSVEEQGNKEFSPQRFEKMAKKHLYGRTIWLPENEGIAFFNQDIASIPRSWLLH
jgi:ATP-dependent DNA ligase